MYIFSSFPLDFDWSIYFDTPNSFTFLKSLGQGQFKYILQLYETSFKDKTMMKLQAPKHTISHIP